ncbi:hypothetical protein DXG03_008302 [Asterophora parasitica]|uniref:Uncharacterized protein n=1 Tax=Asterophora parasitica TaxID=117018 RepID=A0A9P7KD26_9AGAR|nr:hypothetical protein DXG03_008302 [Asterophora parasitica]
MQVKFATETCELVDERAMKMADNDWPWSFNRSLIERLIDAKREATSDVGMTTGASVSDVDPFLPSATSFPIHSCLLRTIFTYSEMFSVERIHNLIFKTLHEETYGGAKPTTELISSLVNALKPSEEPRLAWHARVIELRVRQDTLRLFDIYWKPEVL